MYRMVKFLFAHAETCVQAYVAPLFFADKLLDSKAAGIAVLGGK